MTVGLALAVVALTGTPVFAQVEGLTELVTYARFTRMDQFTVVADTPLADVSETRRLELPAAGDLVKHEILVFFTTVDFDDFGLRGTMRMRVFGVSTDDSQTLLGKAKGTLKRGYSDLDVYLAPEDLAGYDHALVKVRFDSDDTLSSGTHSYFEISWVKILADEAAVAQRRPDPVANFVTDELRLLTLQGVSAVAESPISDAVVYEHRFRVPELGPELGADPEIELYANFGHSGLSSLARLHVRVFYVPARGARRQLFHAQAWLRQNEYGDLVVELPLAHSTLTLGDTLLVRYRFGGRFAVLPVGAHFSIFSHVHVAGGPY